MVENQDNVQSLSFPLDMGDERVFDQIFRLYYAPLCDFSERYLHSKDDAEETIGHLFVNLWNKKAVFSDPDQTRAYLYRSAYNGSLNTIRANKSRFARERAYGMDTTFTEESYLNNMLRSEMIAMIYREIDNLPKHYANVIRMSYVDNKKNEEIAQLSGLSIQTVKNYKNKGMGLLKSRLSGKEFAIISYFLFLEHLKDGLF